MYIWVYTFGIKIVMQVLTRRWKLEFSHDLPNIPTVYPLYQAMNDEQQRCAGAASAPARGSQRIKHGQTPRLSPPRSPAGTEHNIGPCVTLPDPGTPRTGRP